VGEFAIGTNIGLKDVIGNILQDEKLPGVHIAFGDPYGAHTGAQWKSSTHIDVVGRKFDIWADDRQIMSAGEIRRIYNRVIIDELIRKNIASEFSFTDDLDVEWAGHPNWFFLLSKFSLPWFNHPCVPQTKFLSEIPSCQTI
jgi:hypothetical protein